VVDQVEESAIHWSPPQQQDEDHEAITAVISSLLWGVSDVADEGVLVSSWTRSLKWCPECR
jgi:hypothetical protein